MEREAVYENVGELETQALDFTSSFSMVGWLNIAYSADWVLVTFVSVHTVMTSLSYSPGSFCWLFKRLT